MAKKPDTKMQVYYKGNIDADPVLLFEDLDAIPQATCALRKPIMTDQGILLLTDHSDSVDPKWLRFLFFCRFEAPPKP